MTRPTFVVIESTLLSPFLLSPPVHVHVHAHAMLDRHCVTVAKPSRHGRLRLRQRQGTGILRAGYQAPHGLRHVVLIPVRFWIRRHLCSKQYPSELTLSLTVQNSPRRHPFQGSQPNIPQRSRVRGFLYSRPSGTRISIVDTPPSAAQQARCTAPNTRQLLHPRLLVAFPNPGA